MLPDSQRLFSSGSDSPRSRGAGSKTGHIRFNYYYDHYRARTPNYYLLLLPSVRLSNARLQQRRTALRWCRRGCRCQAR